MRATYHFVLPFPPSANNLFPQIRPGKRALSIRGRAYAKHVGQLVLIGHVPRIRLAGRLGVSIIAHPPDEQRRDLDNLFKAPLDALKKAGIIEDDSYFDSLAITRGDVVPGGRLNISLREIEASDVESARAPADA